MVGQRFQNKPSGSRCAQEQSRAQLAHRRSSSVSTVDCSIRLETATLNNLTNRHVTSSRNDTVICDEPPPDYRAFTAIVRALRLAPFA